MITDGEDGWIVLADDRASVVASLVKLARSPDLRRQTGTAARRRMERDFSVDRMAAAYADLYEELSGR